MKIFYRDYTKKTIKEKIGTFLSTCGMIFLILGMSITLFPSIINQQYIFNIYIPTLGIILTMSGVFSCLFGMLFIARKICSNEKKRIFILDDKEDLYLLEAEISDEDIKDKKIEKIKPKDLVFDMVDAMLYSQDKKGMAANNFRDLKVITEYLDSNAKAKITKVKIIKDSRTQMKILIQNTFGWKKELVVSNQYLDYKELAQILRKKAKRVRTKKTK